MTASAQDGCDQSECTNEYCVKNLNVDCEIDVEWEVSCSGGYYENGGFTLNPSHCTLPSTQRCFNLPSCDQCEVTIRVGGEEFQGSPGSECGESACTEFTIDYDPTNGTCLKNGWCGPDCN